MILITGSTGLNGSELVIRLLKRGVPLRAMTRNPRQGAGPFLNWRRRRSRRGGHGSIPRPSGKRFRGWTAPCLISSSVPFHALSRTETNSLIEAAKKAGVRHIVKLSGIIPELDSPFRFARMHAEIEKRLEASGMAYTHLRCGEFMPSYFRQVRLIVAQSRILLPMEEARIASIDVGDIAEAAADCLTQSGHEGKAYPLTGPEALNMSEVDEKLSAVTGKNIQYINVSPEKAREGRLAAGMPPYLADALDELFAERRKGKESQVSPVLQDVFHRPGTRFDEFARLNAAIFRGEQPPPKV